MSLSGLHDYQLDAVSYVTSVTNQSGIIIDFAMGMGKTATTVAIIANLRTELKKVYVFAPTTDVLDEWPRTLRKAPTLARPEEPNIQLLDPSAGDQVDRQGRTWVTEYTYDRLGDFLEASAREDLSSSIMVFDEVHRLSEAVIRLGPAVGGRVVAYLMRSGFRVLVSGTPLFHGLVDIMYLLNLAYGGNEPRFPLTQRGLFREYFRIPASAAAVRGWLLPLVALNFWGVQFTTKFLDIVDFYGSLEGGYRDKKTAFIKGVMPYMGLDPKMAFNTFMRPADQGGPTTFREYISVSLFWFMYSPFHAIVPILFTLLLVSSNEKLYVPRLDTIVKAAWPVMRKQALPGKWDLRGTWSRTRGIPFKSEGLPIAPNPVHMLTPPGLGNLRRSKVKIFTPENTDMYPVRRIVDIRAPYTWQQTRMFMRLTTADLTPTDRKLLQAQDLTNDALAEALKLQLGDEVMNRTAYTRYGMMIGNLSLTKEQERQIKVEHAQMRKPRFATLQTLVDEAKVIEAPPDKAADLPAAPITEEEEAKQEAAIAASDATENMKFRRMATIILATRKDARHIVYSQFWTNGSLAFYKYCQDRPEFSELAVRMRVLVDKQSLVGDRWTTEAEQQTITAINSNSPEEDEKEEKEGEGDGDVNDTDLAKRRYNTNRDAGGTILLLDPRFTEGVSGLKFTQSMHVMEPLRLPAEAAQLHARAARNNSHLEPKDNDPGFQRAAYEATRVKGLPTVTIYEWKMSVSNWFGKNISSKFRQWMLTQPGVIFMNRTLQGSQDMTPDLMVYNAQRASSKQEQAVLDGVASSQPSNIRLSPERPMWLFNSHKPDSAKIDEEKYRDVATGENARMDAAAEAKKKAKRPTRLQRAKSAVRSGRRPVERQPKKKKK